MWGNAFGWIVSAVIALGAGTALWTYGRPEAVPPPSGQFDLKAVVKLPVAPEDGLPGVMTEDRDAGELYRQAITVYREDPKAYDNFELKNAAKANQLQGLELLAQATRANRAKIFTGKPELLINYKPTSPELDALASLGKLCSSIGYYYVKLKPNAGMAAKYLNAEFSLGAKLYEERLTHAELIDGISLMTQSAEALRRQAEAAKNAKREAVLKDFVSQSDEYYKAKIQPLYQYVSTIDPAANARYAGDVFELAVSSPERMWRVESILKVGRYKFEAGATDADQIFAARLLEQPEKIKKPDLSKDPDPAVRAAVKAARDLTLDEHHFVR
jgi:hypothetical protein